MGRGSPHAFFWYCVSRPSTGLLKHGNLFALFGPSDIRTMIAEGEVPGVTANASLKLSMGPRLTVAFLTFSVCVQGGG